MAIGTQWLGVHLLFPYPTSALLTNLVGPIFKTRLETTFSYCCWPVNNHFLPKLLFSFKRVLLFSVLFSYSPFKTEFHVYIIYNTFTNEKSMLHIPVHLQ